MSALTTDASHATRQRLTSTHEDEIKSGWRELRMSSQSLQRTCFFFAVDAVQT